MLSDPPVVPPATRLLLIPGMPAQKQRVCEPQGEGSRAWRCLEALETFLNLARVLRPGKGRALKDEDPWGPLRIGRGLCGTGSRIPLVGSAVLSLHMTGSDTAQGQKAGI